MADFNDCVTGVLLNQPFFGQLLMRYEHKADPTLQHLAAVSRTALLYNPTTFAVLTDDEGVALITHEVMHGVYQHLDEMGVYNATGVGPDGRTYSHSKYNQACDYVINSLIEHNKIGKLPAGGLLDKAYTFTMTPGEVYGMLPDDPPGGGGNGKGDGQTMDGHDWESGDPNKPNAITPADVIQAAATAEAMGALPLGLDRLIEKLKKPRYSPWAILRKLVQSTIGGADAATWRRLHRRLITRGIGAPSRIGFGCNRVGVVVDVSGSIGDEMVALFGGHMGAILQDARPREIRVYWVDAALHRTDVVKTGGQLRTLMSKSIPGGGGTNMPVGVAQAVKDGCEAVVVLTDGYTPFGQPSKTPVIWAITTEIVAPHGRTVNISEH